MDDLRVKPETSVGSDLPEGYRETEIGLLPEEWKVVRLDSLAQLRRDGIHPEEAPHLPYVGLEHIDPGSTRLSKWGEASSVKSGKSHFYPNDVLYGKLRPYLDKAVLSEQEGICSTDILVLCSKEEVDSAFLSYLLHLRRFVEHAIATTTGVNHPRTSWASIRDFETYLPPLSEQKAIARVLRTVQKAIETTEQVIESTRELKRSLMNHLFTYGPVPVDEAEQVPLKETEVGAVPEHWESMTLEKLLRERLRNGHSARATNTDVGVRTLTLSSVTRNDFSMEHSKLTSADPKKVKDLWLQSGDIFIERANTFEFVGLAALYKGPNDFAIYPDLMVRVRVDEEVVSPRFVSEYLRLKPIRAYFRLNARGTAGNMPKIDHGTIKNVPIHLPPTDEQEKIVDLSVAVDQKIWAEQSRKDTLQILFKTLLHNLMTGRARIKDLELSEVEEMV